MEKKENIFKKYMKNGFVICIVLAFCLNLTIETLARFTVSPFGAFTFMFESPLVFAYNTLIIFSTLVIAIIFRRRVFVLFIVVAVWLGIGITNGVILTTRITPFTVKDIAVIEDGLTLVANYMTWQQVIGIIVGVIVTIAVLTLIFIKAPRKKGELKWKRNLIVVILCIAGSFGVTSLMIRSNQVETFFGNLGYAYRDYGVPYCFINTWLNTGINKPDGYTEEEILALLDSEFTNEDGTSLLIKGDMDEEYPNIIFLQLESFIDPYLIKNITLSEDPIPTFRSLMENYSSGKLVVPACGAGTANTEFEVMTGLSVKFFGPGEYPYKSVLKTESAESIAHNLKDIGYSTHAVHNHRAAFYNRNEVFANIGFDTFTSLEYMSSVPKTPKNWAKDGVLTDEMMNIMEATEERDYMYTISVQAHGKYPTEQVITRPNIEVTSAASEEEKWKYEYYVNQLYEMDLFIKDFLEEVENYHEDTIVVMYGDHIPAIDLTEEVYGDGDLYGTQYVIWSNFYMEKEDKELTTYDLTAEVLSRIGLEVGTVFNFQNTTALEGEEYLEGLKMLGYDMLYGKKYLYGEVNPFVPVDIKLGIDKIVIEKVVQIGDKYFLQGQNFTEFSKITPDGEPLDCIYLGVNLLGLKEEVSDEDIPNMKVSQIDKSSNEIISTTE